jgi:hypothetical protein
VILRVLFVLLAIVQSAVVRADEPDPIAVIQRVSPARDRWLACLATQARLLASTGRSPESIADAALKRCSPAEGPVMKIMRQELGAERAKRVLDAVRLQDRSSLIRAIEHRRRD